MWIIKSSYVPFHCSMTTFYDEFEGVVEGPVVDNDYYYCYYAVDVDEECVAVDFVVVS